MRDTLDLDTLRQYIESEKQRQTKLGSRYLWGCGLIIGIGIVASFLKVELGLFRPFIAFMTFMALVGWTWHFVTQVNWEPFQRARQIVERIVPEDKLFRATWPQARTGIEFIPFAISLLVGQLLFTTYRCGVCTSTAVDRIVSDFGNAPERAVPFLLGWTVAIVIVVWWMYRFVRMWSSLTTSDRRKVVSRHFLHLLGAALVILSFMLATFGILLDGLMLLGFALLFSFLVSWITQYLVVLLFVMPHVKMGNYIAASRVIRWLLRVHPKALFLHYMKALNATLQNDFVEAEHLWLKRLEVIQNSFPITLCYTVALIGHVLSRQDRSEESLNYAVAAIEIHPTAANGYMQLAANYIEQGVFLDRALEILQLGIGLHKKREPTWEALHAAALAHNGRFEEASDVLHNLNETRLRTIADKATITFYRAQVAHLQGNLDEARQYCEQAINLDPQGDAPFYREFLQSLDQNPSV